MYSLGKWTKQDTLDCYHKSLLSIKGLDLLCCSSWQVCSEPLNKSSLILRTMLERHRPAPAVGGAVAVFQIRQRDIFCPGLYVITPTIKKKKAKKKSEQRRSSCQAKKKGQTVSLLLSVSVSLTVCPRVLSFLSTAFHFTSFFSLICTHK